MTTVKVSITLPKELLERVDEICKQLNMARSEFIAKVLEEKLGAELSTEGRKYPTVLWKLSMSGYLRLRSPRLRGRSIRERWIVEEVEEG